MKCKECGYENKQDAKFCQGCGAKLGAEVKKNYEPQPQREYYEPMPMPKKKNTGFIVTVISLSVLLVAAIVAIILILVLGGDKKSSGNGSSSGSNSKNESTVVCYESTDDYDGYIYLELEDNIVEEMKVEMKFNSSSYASQIASYLDMSNIKYKLDGKTIRITDKSSIKKMNPDFYVVGKSKSRAIEIMEKDGDTTCR